MKLKACNARILDANVLIALLDSSHIHHSLVTHWLAENITSGWASCPIIQNECIRIFSQPGYPNIVPAAQVAERLAEAAQHPSHEFWPDSVSLLQPDTLIWSNVLSSRQVTDVYLLALAVKQSGRFVILDRGIPLDAVAGALPKHLVTLA